MENLNEIKEIWTMILGELQQRLNLSNTAMTLWFGDISITSFSDNILSIKTSTDYKKEIIESRYIAHIEDLFEVFMGFRIAVAVLVDKKTNSLNLDDLKKRISGESRSHEIDNFDEDNTDEPRKYSAVGSTMPTVNFEYTFDNFIIGSSNKFAHAACIAVADKPAQDYNPLFIYGPSGLGKTHLLYAVTNEIKKKNPSASIIYIKGEDFTNQMIDSLAKKSMSKFREKYRSCDVLLIDDIQFIAGKTSTQEEFFHTFNALYEEGKQIILTSDRPPKDIKTLEERLLTRFEWGLIADIQPPDLELRIAIFKNKIEQAGITVSDEVITYLAENLRSHIRQIEGAVKKLVAVKFLSGSEITMDIAKKCMNELLGGAEPINVTVDKIFAAVEKKYNVSKADLESKSRVKEVAQARHLAIYLIRSITEMSLPHIGKMFNRDHSTVISSIEAIDKKRAMFPSFDAEVSEIKKEILE
ncbi:MAG: chromosomal replication initiator protein DnaA [Clostridia bacterium]|nr:chromosomal replication initiator protein DnaA [Clostridia bacterium]